MQSQPPISHTHALPNPLPEPFLAVSSRFIPLRRNPSICQSANPPGNQILSDHLPITSSNWDPTRYDIPGGASGKVGYERIHKFHFLHYAFHLGESGLFGMSLRHPCNFNLIRSILSSIRLDGMPMSRSRACLAFHRIPAICWSFIGAPFGGQKKGARSLEWTRLRLVRPACMFSGCGLEEHRF